MDGRKNDTSGFGSGKFVYVDVFYDPYIYRLV